MFIIIPDELEDEFDTFIEVGLASVGAYPDELTENELRLVKILENREYKLDIPEIPA